MFGSRADGGSSKRLPYDKVYLFYFVCASNFRSVHVLMGPAIRESPLQ